MTTEEIVQGLENITNSNSDLVAAEIATIRAAIERLRGDEWPRVYRERNGDIRVFKNEYDEATLYGENGINYGLSGVSHRHCKANHELLTGPARAEVLAKLGIQVGDVCE